MSIDLAAVAAIDTHVHIEADAHGCFALGDELITASAKYFKAGADDFAALDIKGDVRPLILKQNAIRVLGLDPA